MTKDLLPCPFCGGEADVDAVDVIIRIGCKACGYWRSWNGLITSVPHGEPVSAPGSECLLYYDKDANEKATAAWNHRHQQENRPLTLDELRQMDGGPVWVSDIDPFSQDKCSCWAIVGDAEEAGIELYDKFCDKNYIDFGASELYGKTWLAYRSKPGEEAL